jgi:hypothetical protein
MVSNLIFLHRSEIDTARWDATAEHAVQKKIYAYSWYLDAVADDWCALVTEDYSSIMPLPCSTKASTDCIYTPPYIQQLGVFSRNEVSAEVLSTFINSIPQRFRHVDLNLNDSNLDAPQGMEIHRNRNLVLSLDKSPELITQSFATNHKRNIRKAARAGLVYDVVSDAEKVIEIWESGRGRTLGEYADMDHSVFRILLSELQQRGKATVLTASSADGDPLAGAVFFTSHNGAYFIFSGTSESGKMLSAMHGLIGHFLESHSAGLKFLDFEGSHLDSLARFYAGFGADETQFLRIVRN